MPGELTPWWVASATGLVMAVGGALARVWSEQRREIKELRSELAAANARIVELQSADHLEHLRDLRKFAGLTTSGPPAAAWPPPVIRKR